ncbi:MAG: repeat-containing protein [Myxococcales bacterium]|nr:repeat-containing protein [Myxococcales bacterium]
MLTRTTWLVMTAITGSALVAGLVVHGRHSEAAQPAPHARSLYEPDPAVVHYKFSTKPIADDDSESIIRELEARLTQGAPSPYDNADLAELYLRRATQSGDPEDYKISEQFARKSLEILPYPNGVALTLAKLANARHGFREAIEIASRHARHSKGSGTHIVMASAHLALGELAEASEEAEIAVSIKSDSSGYLMRALVMQAQGRDAEAAFDFSRALTVEVAGDLQEAARTRTLWGRFLLRRGEPVGAGALFDEALRIVPDYPLALAQRAELALRSGKACEARAMFEQAFATSRQVRYLIDLARAQELSNDPAAAASSRAQVERIVREELRTSGIGHQLDLVEVLVDRGDPADLHEAIALGREELTRRPSAETRFQLSRALYRSGANDEAAIQIRAALASGARDARLYELAARVEQGPRAELYAHEAERLDPGGSGWRSLGMARGAQH